MNVTSINTNTNKSYTQPNFGMKFGEEAKNSLRIFRQFVTPEVKNVILELNKKNDTYLVKNFTIEDLPVNKEEVHKSKKYIFPFLHKRASLKNNTYNRFVILEDTTDNTEVFLRNTNFEDKSFLGLLKALLDDSLLKKLFAEQKVIDAKNAATKAKKVALDAEHLKFVENLK